MKKILITGATGGIGSQIVKTVASKDIEFCLHYFNEERKNEDEFKEISSKIKFLKADLTNERQTQELIQQIISDGGVDIIIHCVSLPISRNEIIKKEWNDFQDHINIQLRSLFTIVKGLIPLMINKQKGKIINILTEYVVGKPPVHISDYITAKYALLGFSKSIASEYGRYNITCNCVSPGITETNLTSDIPSKFKDIVASQTPLKRITTKDDIASVVKFLCSDESDFITGENILINGGFAMR